MNKKIKKVVICLLIFVLLILCFSKNTFADWDPKIKTLANGTVKNAGGMAIDVIGSVLNLAQVIGTGIAIVVLVIVGIQYIIASPSEKAEIKNKTTNYIIGAVLIFSGAAILQIAKMFLESNVKFI